MRPQLTLEQQARLVARWHRDVKPYFRWIDGERWLLFELILKPTPTSDDYRVLFCYTLGTRPFVYVLDPEPVRDAHGHPTPHLNGDGTLCLYDPEKRQWSETDALIDTVVQWTGRWLFHYEHWLAFGEWRGDQPPSVRSKPEPPNSYTTEETL